VLGTGSVAADEKISLHVSDQIGVFPAQARQSQIMNKMVLRSGFEVCLLSDPRHQPVLGAKHDSNPVQQISNSHFVYDSCPEKCQKRHVCSFSCVCGVLGQRHGFGALRSGGHRHTVSVIISQ
jgi:hypothetical protein